MNFGWGFSWRHSCRVMVREQCVCCSAGDLAAGVLRTLGRVMSVLMLTFLYEISQQFMEYVFFFF